MRTIVAVGVMALAMVGSARAGVVSPYPWLTAWTGTGGSSVNLTADVSTITNTSSGFVLTGLTTVSAALSNATAISVEMDFASPCEFTVGCVISGPLSVAIDGMVGNLTVFGEKLTLDGIALDWDGNPDGTPNGFVSGDLSFASAAGFTDDEEVVAISAVPEPASWLLLGVGLLGLGLKRKHSGVV